MAQPRYDNPITATLIALRDLVVPAPRRVLSPADRLDGKTALVTGANRGLGKAVAEQLARRGARVLCAVRSEADETLRSIRSEGGEAELFQVDLGDLETVRRLADDLRGEDVEVVVLNAGVVPSSGRRTRQGVELQLSVHYLANFVLMNRLRADGTMKRGRVVAVSSESHRSATEVDFERFGAFEHYGLTGTMRQYSYTKLLLTAWALELAERAAPDIRVFPMCPGPVSSGIAREAPAWSQPLLGPIMKAFAAPEDAAQPIAYLAASHELDGRTGAYFHRWVEKEPSPLALDAALRDRLWDETEALLSRIG